MRKRWLKFWLKYKERLRPFFRETVPPRLCLDWGEYYGQLDMFLRNVGARVSLELFGSHILPLLDKESAHKIPMAWKPKELLLLEKLAIAYHIIEDRLRGGIIPEVVHVERLIELVFQWRQLVDRNVTRDTVHANVTTYVQEHTSEHAIPEADGPRRIIVDHPLLDELYEIEESIDLHVPGIERATTFDEIGLMLAHPLGSGRYDHCTPMNCTVFAHTGGDGVHYSLLERDGRIDADSPVVMTMPAYCTFIVGETLHDFLSLGHEWGYFSIEQIGYDETNLALYLDGHPCCEPNALHEIADCMNPIKRKILELFQDRFDLRPWTDPEHWQRLQEKYQPLLQFPPNF